MSEELKIMQIAALADEYADAMAIGDRLKAGGVLKKLRDLLMNIDIEKLAALIKFFQDLLGGGEAAPAQVQACGVTALSVEDAESAGIADNAQFWIELATLLFAAIRRLRGK